MEKSDSSYRKDYERSHRLKCKENIDNVRHCRMTFKVFLKSMNFRYHLEMLFFLAVMIAFTVYILMWIAIFQSNADDTDLLVELF